MAAAGRDKSVSAHDKSVRVGRALFRSRQSSQKRPSPEKTVSRAHGRPNTRATGGSQSQEFETDSHKPSNSSKTAAARQNRRRRIAEVSIGSHDGGENGNVTKISPAPHRISLSSVGNSGRLSLPAESRNNGGYFVPGVALAIKGRSRVGNKNTSSTSSPMVAKRIGNGRRNNSINFRSRVRVTTMPNDTSRRRQNSLIIDVEAAEADHRERSKKAPSSSSDTPKTDISTPTSNDDTRKASKGKVTPKINGGRTPAGVRGRGDIRSPGVKKTPNVAKAKLETGQGSDDEENIPIPDFITQTDRYGNASTPRSADAIASARNEHPSGPQPHIHIENGKVVDETSKQIPTAGSHSDDQTQQKNGLVGDDDPCDTLLESIRMMCCCLVAENTPQVSGGGETTAVSPTPPTVSSKSEPEAKRSQYSTRGANAPMLLPTHSAALNEEIVNDENRVKLLPEHHPEDIGKKCLVLDLDETLVHSSFRAVPGADFVIPVQIEDVVHFVYVVKRPGVDEFLTEMAKHYEVVVYTASLNKYADPLLDLLDPIGLIRTRLFRESCVYYEGNYVKDLSLLDRDLSQSIIVDNSPSSYIFHPENAIDCTSFIDDPEDFELDQIGRFLLGIKNIKDVRHISNMWREWPHLPVHVEDLNLDEEYGLGEENR